jgi:Tfp pilus assembly protein PilE
MKSPRIMEKSKGFTLIELIFEIIVLAALVIPTAILLGHLSINVAETEIQSTATLLGIQKAEEIYWTNTFSTVSDDTGNFDSPYGEYSYTLTIQYVDPNDLDSTVALSDYKKATLTISHSGIQDLVINMLFVDILLQ